MTKPVSSQDALYATPLSSVAQFCFGEAVANVFDDMINRSVPGYASLIALIGQLTEQYAQDHTHCYDLGCSLGEASMVMATAIEQRDHCRLIAVDSSDAMIKRCQQRLAKHKLAANIEVIEQDISQLIISKASVVVLNFTLQFIAPKQRLALIKGIYQGLVPGGILLLSEKIAATQPQQAGLFEHWHAGFKRSQGYSELEISQKRQALEHFLRLDTLEQHCQRLAKVGFSSYQPWFQCFNFVSLFAQKPPLTQKSPDCQ